MCKYSRYIYFNQFENINKIHALTLILLNIHIYKVLFIFYIIFIFCVTDNRSLTKKKINKKIQ